MTSSARGGGAFGIDRGISVLILNRAAIQAFNLPGGMTYRYVRSIARETKIEAQASLVPGRGFVTGALQRSVGDSVTPAGPGVVAHVRATSDHAYLYHEGFRPHLIEANPPRRFLKFRPYHGLGAEVFARRVMHPGFSGHPFLREAMIAALARRGILRG